MSLKGVLFGSIHTESFNMVLSKVVIETPEVKSHSADILGSDGSLDLTEYFGGVKYKNRMLRFEFTFTTKNNELLSDFSRLVSAVHGKHFSRIILDDDTGHYYIGRAFVGKLIKGKLSKVTIDCECEPYRIKTADGSRSL